MTDHPSALQRLAEIPAGTDFGYWNQLKQLRDEMTKALGARRTREIWKQLSPIKKGRIAGERTYADISPLVSVFDAARAHADCADWSDTRIRDALGAEAHARWPLEYGATAAGISKRVGRALLSRAEEAEKAKKRAATLHRNLLADLLMSDMKSQDLLSGTQNDGVKSPLLPTD